MITKVTLENFQAHKYSVIELTDGINVISGASDQGKSSVIRAIKWVTDNRPSGFAFKREGAKKPTRVTLELDNGHTIVKERSAKDHFYKVIYHDGREEAVFKALRTDVPDEIKKILNFGEYNIQSQTDGAFLIDSTSGETARMLNVLSGISIIDSVLKETNKRIRDKKAAKDATASLLKEAKLKLSSPIFKNLEKAKKILQQAEEVDEDLQENKEGWKQLVALTYNYGSLEARKKKIVDTKTVNAIVKQIKTKLEDLRELYDGYAILESAVTNLMRVMSKLDDLALVEYTDEKCAVVRKHIQTYKEDVANLKAQETLINRYDINKQELHEINKIVTKTEKELEKFKKENKVCPLCKNAL